MEESSILSNCIIRGLLNPLPVYGLVTISLMLSTIFLPLCTLEVFPSRFLQAIKSWACHRRLTPRRRLSLSSRFGNRQARAKAVA